MVLRKAALSPAIGRQRPKSGAAEGPKEEAGAEPERTADACRPAVGSVEVQSARRRSLAMMGVEGPKTKNHTNRTTVPADEAGDDYRHRRTEVLPGVCLDSQATVMSPSEALFARNGASKDEAWTSWAPS